MKLWIEGWSIDLYECQALKPCLIEMDSNHSRAELDYLLHAHSMISIRNIAIPSQMIMPRSKVFIG